MPRARRVLLPFVTTIALAFVVAPPSPAYAVLGPGDVPAHRPVRGPQAPAEHEYLQDTNAGRAPSRPRL